MSKPSRLNRVLLAPIRALGCVRDFYMRSITRCAGQMNYGAGFGYDAYNLPRSFSTTSGGQGSASDEDLRELIRIASQKQAARGGSGLNGLPPRSRSVAVGRIDEDSPFDLSGASNLDVGSNLLFPRSQSYAAAGRIVGGKGLARSIA